MKCPCKGCGKRTITCHSVCAEYKEWSAHNEQIREMKRKETDRHQLSHGIVRKHWRNLKLGRSITQR